VWAISQRFSKLLGLESRFDNTFIFQDFNENELWIIAKNMLQNKGLALNAEAEKHLREYIGNLYKNRNRFFGNARSMRKITEKIIRNQELRMAELPKKLRTAELMAEVILTDVKEFVYIENLNKPLLGFKISS
jgi:hypothetical protein